MKYTPAIIILLLFCSYRTFAQADSLSSGVDSLILANEDSITLDTTEIQEFSLIFTGDIMQHDPQVIHALNPITKEYEYDSNFYHIAPILKSAEYTVGNLELTLAGPPYSGYPTFCSPDELAVAIKDAGVDCLVTANNHSCDKRKKGLTRTIKVLDSLNLPHTGTFLNETARDTLYPMIIDQYGFRLALLNYTFSTNGIPIPKGTVVNMIDKDQIRKDLEKACSMNPEKVIVVMHWGYEYKSLPNSEQKRLADFLVENGADIIIGMHPHWIQPMENYYDEEKGKDIVKVYSLGNFISNQRRRHTDGGALVRVELHKQGSKVTVGEVGHVLIWVDRKTVDKRSYWSVLPASYFEQHPELISSSSYEKLKVFLKDSRTLLSKHNVNFPEYVWSEEIQNYVLK